MELGIAGCAAKENTEPTTYSLYRSYVYYINYTTIELFSMSLKAKTKISGLIEIVAAATEFAELEIRHGEDILLKNLSSKLPSPLPTPPRRSAHPTLRPNRRGDYYGMESILSGFPYREIA